MKAAGIMALVGAGAVAACASAPAPVVPMDFASDIRPGSGHALTRNGAVPVQGMTVAVSREGIGYDQGLAAKRMAEQACTARGMIFNPAAVGRFASPEWLFAGACA